jgi:hypothetical protein
MSGQRCIHCGELIEFLRLPQNYQLAQDHPNRLEFETFGGWWVHASGPARYLQMCGFGDTLDECIENYFKFKNARATPNAEAA